MQVLLHTDKNIDGGVRTAEYLETLTQDELHRFGEHITRVEAHLADANDLIAIAQQERPHVSW